MRIATVTYTAPNRPPIQAQAGALAALPEAAKAAIEQSRDEHQRDRADDEREGRRLHAAEVASQARVDRRLHPHQDAGPRRENDGQRTRHRFARTQSPPARSSCRLLCPHRRVTSPPASSGPRRCRPRAAGRAPTRRPSPRSISSHAASRSAGGLRTSSSSWIVRIRRVREAGLTQRVVTADHRQLDDVRGRALDHGVDRQTLAERTHLVVAGLQLWDLAAATPQRLDVTLLLGPLDRLGDESGHAREALQVGVDELFGLLTRDVQTVGEAEVGESVDDPVVDHLRLRAHSRIDLVGRRPRTPARRSPCARLRRA